MTKIRTSHADLFGKKVNLPDIGEVSVDAEGLIEADVPEEVATALVSSKMGYAYDGVVEDEETEESETDGTDLSGLDITALRKICKESKFPSAEWAKIKEVELLRSYIQGKLDEASEEE